MKEVVIDSESEIEQQSYEDIPKINIISEKDKNNIPSTSSSNNQNKNNNNLDTPPHTPTTTIFVTSKSTVSSLDAFDNDNNENNQPNNASSDVNTNEIKSPIDGFDLYVEDIFNRLALENNLSPEAEADTEETPSRVTVTRLSPENYLTEATTEGTQFRFSVKPSNSDNHLTTVEETQGRFTVTRINPDNHLIESLTLANNNSNTRPSSEQPSSLNTTTQSTDNPISTSENTPAFNNIVNSVNVNIKKEVYSDSTGLKKNNENKKDKKIDEDNNNSREKENRTNDHKAKNSDIEKYLEKENNHSIVESMEVLNNTIEMLKCGICLDILLDPKIVEPCGHSFCNHCLRMLQTRFCPLCRTRIHDYHSSVLLNELSELIAKFSLTKDQLEERNQCCQEIEEKDKHLNDECMRLMALMELAHQPENTNNYSVQFHELVELNETDDDI